jgi:small-conductance mechanosensitive channel
MVVAQGWRNIRVATLALACVLALPATGLSQAVDADGPVTLTILNRPVMEFRSSLRGMGPGDRADAATLRIRRQLESRGPGVVTTSEAGGEFAVYLDGRLAFNVLAGDANPLLDETPADIAQRAAAALTLVARESAEATSPRARLVGAAWVAGYVVAWVVGWALLLKLRRRAREAVERLVVPRTGPLTEAATAVLTKVGLARRLSRVIDVLVWVAATIITIQLAGLVLQEFPYTRPWGERLDGFLLQLIGGTLTSIALAVPDLVVVVVIVLLARLLIAITRGIFGQVQEGRLQLTWLDRDLALPTQRLVTTAVVLFALAMAYPYLPGSGSAAFNGVSVLAGLMVSLGGASSVGQSIAGLILMYSRTYRVGDYVKIDDIEGSVINLTLMQTRLRTGMGEEVVIANSRVVGAVIRNYSRPMGGPGMVVDAAVTIGYDAPWRQVHGLLMAAAARTDGITAQPPPQVYQTALADFYVEYRLVCQTTLEVPRRRAELRSSLHAHIQDAFNEAGVQIMSPHYRSDPAEPKIVPKSHWNP